MSVTSHEHLQTCYRELAEAIGSTVRL